MANKTSIVWRDVNNLISDAVLDSHHLLLWKECQSIVASLSPDQQYQLGNALHSILEQLREVWKQEGNEEGYTEAMMEEKVLHEDGEVVNRVNTLLSTITDIAYYQSAPQNQLNVDTKQLLWRHDMRELHRVFYALDTLREDIQDSYSSRLPQSYMLFEPKYMGFKREEEPLSFRLDLTTLQQAANQVADYVATRYKETNPSGPDWLLLQDVAIIQRELHTALEQIHDWEVQHGCSPKVQNSPSLFPTKSGSD